MNPTTKETFDEANRVLVENGQQAIPSGNTTITADALQTPETPLTLPPTPAPRETGIANVEDLIAQAMAPDPLEAERKQAAETQANIIGGGSSADTRAQAQESAGFQDAKAGQLRAAGIVQRLQAEEDTLEERLQASVRGRGVTEGGLRPTRTAQQRDLAVRKRFAVADLLVAQGDFQAAQEEVNQAVNDEFADRENAVQAQQVRIDYLNGLADRNQIKLTNAQNIRLQERQRLINAEAATVADQKAVRKSISEVMLTAQQFGADPSVVESIKGATTLEDAIQQAGSSLRDPAAIQQLENLKLDFRMKQLNLKQKNAEIEIFEKYGGMSPEDYNKAIEEQTSSMEQAQGDALMISDSLTSVSAILNGAGLSTVVGASPFSRGTVRQKGKVGNVLSAITAPLPGISTGFPQEITGDADDTVALVQQIIDQQFLDKLIEVKAKGATFGALSDAEGAALRNAANAIAGARICEGGTCKDGARTIGYDMSEREFKKQMAIIERNMNIAYKKATGDSFTPGEKALFDAMEDDENAVIDPRF